MLERRAMYINGQWTRSAQRQDLEVINPATEEACAVISLGGQADTDAAVAAAKTAFHAQEMATKKDRIACVERIFAAYKSRADDMAEAISLEMGAPIDMARTQQSPAGLSHIKNFIRVVKNFEFDHLLGDYAPNQRILYEPIGVCGLITPWNWPMNQVTLKVIPAIATGCAMVLKPSEIAPLSSILFAEIVDEADVPNGVFNLVNGNGEGVGTQLCAHTDVDMISFTGSTRAGTLVSKNAADTHKKVHLELGGKGANIVFNDADENAVKRGTLHCFGNSGQSCNAPTRMLVQREFYTQAIEVAASVAQSCRVGMPHKPGRHIGPVVSRAQFDKVQRLIQCGIDEGARLIAGGLGRPDGFEKGYFVQPTVFADVTNQMTIAREEIFGPVLSIIPFDNEEEAIEIANDTRYGLTNYIQSVDHEKCQRVARKLRSGMVEINGQSLAAGSPFGGVKASGNGREGGVWGLKDFLEVKAVSGWTG